MIAKKEPIWINIVNLVVIIILSVKTYSAFFHPSLVYGVANNQGTQNALLELGGRNIVMITITLVAMFSKSLELLRFVFIMHFFREGIDMLLFSGTTHKGIITFMMFGGFLAIYVVAYRTLTKLTQQNKTDSKM